MRKHFLLNHRVLLVLILTWFTALNAVFGQGISTSSISGIIADTKNAGLPGATVVAIHTPSGTRYGTVANAAGRYTFPAVRIGGPYRLTATFIGYREQTNEIGSADLGVPVESNFRLLDASSQLSEVTVTSQRGSIIDASRTGASFNIKRESFERLPTLNRSFQDLSNITPQSSGNFSFGGRSNLYNNFTIDGATSNNVFGLSATPGGQSNAQPVSVDAIQELSVQLAPYDVSQGSFTGAGVNAVTRSGTNELQGSAYYFTKSDKLAKKKVEGTELTEFQRQPFSYNNYGIRLGGPLIKNKLFFFVNGEFEKATAPGVIYPADGTGNQPKSVDLKRLRDFLVTPNNGKSWTFDPGTYDSFDAPQQSVKFLAKIDWNINDQHKFTVRYNQLNAYRDVTISGSGGFTTSPPGGRSNSNNALPFSRSWYRIKNDFYNVIGELNSSFGKGKYANNLQLGYTALRDIRQSGGGSEIPNFPLVDIIGANGNVLTSFGPDPFTPNNQLDQDVFQVNDKFDLFLGNHTVTIGTANEFYRFYNVFTQLINGAYQYNSIDDFIANATAPTATNAPARFYQQYAAIPGNSKPAAEWRAAQFGFYAQDSYTGIKNLRLTLGLRVDIPSYPKSGYTKNAYTDSLSNAGAFSNGEKIYVDQLPKTTPLFSPRIGFNWDVKGDRSIQVRGGTGIFTGRVPFVWLSNQLSNNGVFFGTTNRGTQAENAALPFNPDINAYVPTLKPFTGSPATPTFAVNATSSNFKFPQVFRSNVAVDKTLPGGFVATLEAIYTKDLNAVFIRDANLSRPVGVVAGDGRNLYGAVAGAAATAAPNDRRLNDRVEQALVLDNVSQGYALNLTAQIQKTTGRLTGSLAYTFTDSKDLNNQSGSTAGSLFTGNAYVNDPNLPSLSYANNWFPHRVVGFVSYRFDYLDALATTLSLTYEGRAGGNLSYVYNSNINASTYGNGLIYVPRSQNEILLTTTNASDTRSTTEIWNQLNAYIEQDSYLSKRRGQYAERNGALLPFFHSVNFRLLQDFYVKVGGKRNTLQASLEVINVLNALNSNWGLLKTPARSSLLTFVGYETPNTATVPTTGRPIYAFATNPDGSALSSSYINNVNISNGLTNSRAQVQVGLRYIFN